MPLMASNIGAGASLAVCSSAGKRVPRGLYGLDLFEKKFESIKLTVDERFEMLRQGAAVAGLEFFQPLAPVASQRLISGYALAE